MPPAPSPKTTRPARSDPRAGLAKSWSKTSARKVAPFPRRLVRRPGVAGRLDDLARDLGDLEAESALLESRAKESSRLAREAAGEAATRPLGGGAVTTSAVAAARLEVFFILPGRDRRRPQAGAETPNLGTWINLHYQGEPNEY